MKEKNAGSKKCKWTQWSNIIICTKIIFEDIQTFPAGGTFLSRYGKKGGWKSSPSEDTEYLQ